MAAEHGHGSTETMPPYDAGAWEGVHAWKQRRFGREGRRLLPQAVRERLDRARAAAKDRLDALPGADGFESAFVHALRGITDLGTRAARASVRRGAVVRAYQKRGFAVDSLYDIRSLQLHDIDRVKPRLDLAYIAASTVEGAGAGLAVSGGTLLATGGAALGAGAGAAPGVGTVVGALAADAAAVLITSHRAVAHIAAYYGYDVDDPQERLIALGVLGVGTADTGKAAAYLELNRLVQGLARRQTWQQLNRTGVTRIVQQVYAKLGTKLTQRKLAQALPVAGVVIGAGLNAKLLSRIADDAEQLYRERFLREKYGLSLDLTERGNAAEEAVGFTDIIDAEVVAETGAEDGRGDSR